MLHKLSNENSIFKFSKNNNWGLKVNSGDTVEIETKDCFSDLIKAENDLVCMDWDKVNPACAPIFVEEAKTGDALKVTIKSIKLKDKGVIATGKDTSILGNKIKNTAVKVVDVKDGLIYFDSKLCLPVKPMIGVIGVAPLGEDINNGTPGHHGGNMDNAMINEGATVYFPVFNDGAYFSLGDVHAAMGDGEIGGTGVEIGAFVTVKIEVIKGLKLNNPLLQNDKYLATIASHKKLDDAVEIAVCDMLDILKERIELSEEEISMLFSISCDLQICQVVDPLRTARFLVPKWILEKYDFKLI